jgi:hypothetical protein
MSELKVKSFYGKITLFWLVFVPFLQGCSSNEVFLHPNNALIFNRNGIPVTLRGPTDAPIADKDFSDDNLIPMKDQEYDNHIDAIFHAYSSWQQHSKAKKAIAIVIHGGLDNYNTSLKSMDALFHSPASKEAQDKKNGNNGVGRGLDDDEFPISVIWNAGIWDALGDRYKRVRHGISYDNNQTVVSFFSAVPLFVNDTLIMSPAEFPKDYFFSYLPSWASSYKSDKLLIKRFEEESKFTTESSTEPKLRLFGNVHDEETGWSVVERSLTDLFWVFPWSVVVEGTLIEPGKWSYYMMQRHIERLFQIDKHDQYYTEANDGEVSTAPDFASTYYNYTKPRYPDLPIVGNGPLGVFLRRLRKFQSEHSDVQVNIYAHSMGTMVADNLVRRAQGFKYEKNGKTETEEDIRFGKIVFMSGADTLRNWQNSIWPYLLGNKTAKFYNFTLNPLSEYREQDYFMPRGSLLTWIDDYLIPEKDRLDRTVGRLENLMYFPHELPWEIRDQINFITFPARDSACPDNQYENCHMPQVHSDTFKLKFWRPEMYAGDMKDKSVKK